MPSSYDVLAVIDMQRLAAATRRALEAASFRLDREEEVAVGNVEDRPGVAANIFQHIADANVNVTFSYLAAGNRMIIGASDVRKVAEILKRTTRSA